MDDSILIVCPHCTEMMSLIKSQINCAIYRHGVYKDTYEQMDPHASKEVCDKLVKKDEIYGCGKPFKLFQNKNPTLNTIEYYVEKCDYI